MSYDILKHILCVAFLSVFTAFAGIQLASEGKTTFSIVLRQDAIASEQTAAKELQYHLKEMTGADFPIVNENDFTGGHSLAIGFQRRLPETFAEDKYPDLGPEEIVIASNENTILLAGGRPRGALYACYEFLESLGIRWYTPTETIIPKRPNLDIVVKAERYTSPFVSRTNVFGNRFTPAWTARNRINSLDVWGNPGAEYGGGVLQGPDMHTLRRLFSNNEVKAHPEWAPMIDGKRITDPGSADGWTLCLSNKALQDLIVSRTMKWLREHPDASAVWFGQNDGSPYCTCPECQAIYDAHGGVPSAIIAIILNKLADAVAKFNPNCTVKTLAYGWSLTPPTNIKLRSNVTIMLCAGISYYDEVGVDAGAQSFLQDVENWKKIASNFEVYVYSHPTKQYWEPVPCLYSQAKNIKAFHKLGITSIHQELFGINGGNGGEFVDLRSWLYSHLAWRPDSDIETLIQDFCHGYYGDAADDVLFAVHKIEEAHAAGWRPTGQVIDFVTDELQPLVIENVRQRMLACYEKQSDPILKRRIGYILLPFLWADYWINFHGEGKIDEVNNIWGVDFSNRKRCAFDGRLMKQLMIDNNVNAIKIGGDGKINPHSFIFEEMTRAYDFVKLSQGNQQIIVVPGLMGKMVDMSMNGKSLLKSMWGHQRFQYPIEGYGKDSFFGHIPGEFSVSGTDANSVMISAAANFGTLTKRFSLNDGKVGYSLSVTATKACEGSMTSSPRFNLNPDVFGIYPKFYVQKGEKLEMDELGKHGTFWYQEGGFDLQGYTGKMFFIAEDGHIGLEIQVPPEQLASVSYMYDRYDFSPKGSGRLLELRFNSTKANLQPGDSTHLDITYKILPPEDFPQLP